jgi:hypothetical protein
MDLWQRGFLLTSSSWARPVSQSPPLNISSDSVVMDTSSDFFLAQLPLCHTFVRHHFVVTDLHRSKFFADMSQEIRRCLQIGILVSPFWSLNPSNSFLLLVPFPAAGVFEPVEASKVCIKGFCIYLTVEIASLRSVRPEAP